MNIIKLLFHCTIRLNTAFSRGGCIRRLRFVGLNYNLSLPSLKIQSFDLTAENFSSFNRRGSSTADASAKITICFSYKLQIKRDAPMFHKLSVNKCGVLVLKCKLCYYSINSSDLIHQQCNPHFTNMGITTNPWAMVNIHHLNAAIRAWMCSH